MRTLLIDEKIEFPLTSRVSIRIYADTRPHALQTMRLQKGGILVVDGRELAEEGLGLGFPVCLYQGRACFALNATTLVDDSNAFPSVTKIFDMNAIELKRFRGTAIESDSYSEHAIRALESAYRTMGRLHVARIMLDVASKLGLSNEYMGCPSKGQVSVSYERKGGALRITVGFDSLVLNHLQAIVIGNEQGGTLFNRYSDPFVRLEGKEIEPWRLTSVEWAALGCPVYGVGFKLRRVDDWQIIRGREVVENRVSWSGLNLMRDGVPESKRFSYDIELVGDSRI